MSRSWYMTVHDAKPRGRVQIDEKLRSAAYPRHQRDAGYTLPEHVLRLAQAEYERQFGHQQDYERMQERRAV